MFVDSINYSYEEMLTANKVGWQFKTIGEKETQSGNRHKHTV